MMEQELNKQKEELRMMNIKFESISAEMETLLNAENAASDASD